MYKLNAQRVFDVGQHEITLFGIAYYGVSHEGNLVPIGYGQDLDDTLDPRQKDQTHTALLAADDRWKLGSKDEVAFSGFARTYNLALFSNFGEGLIRQSEFRTVEGAQARETHTFAWPWDCKAWPASTTTRTTFATTIWTTILSYNDAQVYGPFVKVLSSNVTIRDLTPLRGRAWRPGQAPALLRRPAARHDRVEKRQQVGCRRFVRSLEHFSGSQGHLGLDAGNRFVRAGCPRLRSAWGRRSLRRIRASLCRAHSRPTGAAALPSPFERSHSMQLGAGKRVLGHRSARDHGPDNNHRDPGQDRPRQRHAL